MSIELTVSPEIYERIKTQGFDMALGYWFWNMAVMIAPEDTGNLRASIALKKNKPRRIKISYDTSRSNYTKFLEEGLGPVKKYKDFIKKDTAEAITEQLVSWILTGKAPSYAVQGVKPFVVLNKSKHQPFSREKVFLKQANMNANVITAKTRMEISRIRELSYTGNKSTSTGQKPTKLVNSRGGNKGMSNLNRIYKERVAQAKS